MKKLLGNLVSYSHWGIMILLMFGDKIFAAMGMAPPPIYYTIVEKKWMVIIASYFLTNQISTFLLNSGAFEVFVNGDLVHSKLTSGKIPDPIMILGIIKSTIWITLESYA
jgi:thioredoxin reductase-like selenoprotein T